MFEQIRLTLFQKILIIAVMGLVLRYVVGILFTYPRDIASWALNIDNFLAGGGLYELPGHYYTPVWGYMLAPVAWLMGVLGIPSSHMNPDYLGGLPIYPWFTMIPSLEFILIIKTILFIVDLLVAFLIFKIIMHITGDEKKAILGFAIWFLCPLTIDISAIRVMFENVEIFFLLASLYLHLKGKVWQSGFLLGLSLMTKPYGIVMGILMIGWTFARTGSLKQMLHFTAGVVISVFVIMLPVMMTGQLDEAMIWLTDRVSEIDTGFNRSLKITPIVIAATIVCSIAIALLKKGDVNVLMSLSLMLTGALLLLPGTVQYYLLLLPMAILIDSRWTWPFFGVVLLLSAQAILTYADWSAQYYIRMGWPGFGLLDRLIEMTAQFQSNFWFDALKRVTGMIAFLTPMAIIFWRRIGWKKLRLPF